MNLTQIRKDLAVAGTDRDAVLRLQQELPFVLNKFEQMVAEEERAAAALEEIVKANEEFETTEVAALEDAEVELPAEDDGINYEEDEAE